MRTAASGKEALAILEYADSFAAIIADSQMAEMDGFAFAEKLKNSPSLAKGAALLVLTPVGLRGVAERCRELAIGRYVTKPVSEAELITALAAVLGGGAPAIIDETTPQAQQPARRKLRILLAEDNLVNQKLAMRLLDKQGYDVAVRGTGKQALEASERETFDLILMDIQMPEMDGLQATAQIRERETNTGQHIPIIAMTAHAMQGDRERFLAAGMDDYISKPIQARELYNLIQALAISESKTVQPV